MHRIVADQLTDTGRSECVVLPAGHFVVSGLMGTGSVDAIENSAIAIGNGDIRALRALTRFPCFTFPIHQLTDFSLNVPDLNR
jgi:hypothetical protein